MKNIFSLIIGLLVLMGQFSAILRAQPIVYSLNNLDIILRTLSTNLVPAEDPIKTVADHLKTFLDTLEGLKIKSLHTALSDPSTPVSNLQADLIKPLQNITTNIRTILQSAQKAGIKQRAEYRTELTPVINDLRVAIQGMHNIIRLYTKQILDYQAVLQRDAEEAQKRLTEAIEPTYKLSLNEVYKELNLVPPITEEQLNNACTQRRKAVRADHNALSKVNSLCTWLREKLAAPRIQQEYKDFLPKSVTMHNILNNAIRDVETINDQFNTNIEPLFRNL